MAIGDALDIHFWNDLVQEVSELLAVLRLDAEEWSEDVLARCEESILSEDLSILAHLRVCIALLAQDNSEQTVDDDLDGILRCELLTNFLDLLFLQLIEWGMVLGVHDVRALGNILLDLFVVRVLLRLMFVEQEVHEFTELLTFNDLIKMEDVGEAKTATIAHLFNLLQVNLGNVDVESLDEVNDWHVRLHTVSLVLVLDL